jgi:hypothetical protein
MRSDLASKNCNVATRASIYSDPDTVLGGIAAGEPRTLCSTYTIAAGQSGQAAIDAAKSGDTIVWASHKLLRLLRVRRDEDLTREWFEQGFDRRGWSADLLRGCGRAGSSFCPPSLRQSVPLTSI